MGTKTFLNGVNATLRRAKRIQSDLTTFTDTSKQVDIDNAKEIWNEVIQELYSRSGKALPFEAATDTITLATDVREYILPNDLEQIRYPLIDETNEDAIHEYQGGYEAMRAAQLKPSNWAGTPQFATINPETNWLRVDRTPTSADNGNVYTLLYDKRISLDLITDVFPFSDTVYDALVPVTREIFMAEKYSKLNQKFLNTHFARAAKYLSQMPTRATW